MAAVLASSPLKGLKMNRLVATLVLASLASFSAVGCSGEKKSTIKEETKITAPGGTTTITTEKDVKTTGKNPPGTP
jgi:hypothetical protein